MWVGLQGYITISTGARWKVHQNFIFFFYDRLQIFISKITTSSDRSFCSTAIPLPRPQSAPELLKTWRGFCLYEKLVVACQPALCGGKTGGSSLRALSRAFKSNFVRSWKAFADVTQATQTYAGFENVDGLIIGTGFSEQAYVWFEEFNWSDNEDSNESIISRELRISNLWNMKIDSQANSLPILFFIITRWN